jgi:hypothetical protein
MTVSVQVLAFSLQTKSPAQGGAIRESKRSGYATSMHFAM